MSGKTGAVWALGTVLTLWALASGSALADCVICPSTAQTPTHWEAGGAPTSGGVVYSKKQSDSTWYNKTEWHVSPNTTMNFKVEPATGTDMDRCECEVTVNGQPTHEIDDQPFHFRWWILKNGQHLEYASGATYDKTFTELGVYDILLQGDGHTGQGGNCYYADGWTYLGKSVRVYVCGHAHPTNCRQTAGEDKGNGVLYFKYEWDSDSGDLDDLGPHCRCGEKVVYPGPLGQWYYYPDPPFDTSGDDWRDWNPTQTPYPYNGMTSGVAEDWILLGGGFHDYCAQSVTANQQLWWRCNECMPTGLVIVWEGPLDIVRSVENVGGWRYHATKKNVHSYKALP